MSDGGNNMWRGNNRGWRLRWRQQQVTLVVGSTTGGASGGVNNSRRQWWGQQQGAPVVESTTGDASGGVNNRGRLWWSQQQQQGRQWWGQQQGAPVVGSSTPQMRRVSIKNVSHAIDMFRETWKRNESANFLQKSEKFLKSKLFQKPKLMGCMTRVICNIVLVILERKT